MLDTANGHLAEIGRFQTTTLSSTARVQQVLQIVSCDDGSGIAAKPRRGLSGAIRWRRAFRQPSCRRRDASCMFWQEQARKHAAITVLRTAIRGDRALCEQARNDIAIAVLAIRQSMLADPSS